jgi:hypothetical protein
MEGGSVSSQPGEPGNATERSVLEGVPRIGFHLHLCPFPGSLYSCMEYLGEPCSYDYLMGVTGAAFRRFWQRDDGGNVDLMYLAPEPHRRAFAALGRGHQVVPSSDKAAMVRALRESVALGRPVLAFGIIGPPECGVVAGYDRGGEVLVGYSYFQDASIPGYYERSDWYERAGFAGGIGFIVIGDRVPRPPERDTLVSSLEWAVDLARRPRRPERPEHLSGLAAYGGWADGLEVDGDYPRNDPTVLATRAMVHGDQATMLEERRSGASYLRSMVEVAPEAADDLLAAATLYDEAAGEMAGIWLWGFDMGPEVADGLVDAGTRRGIARHVRAAGEKEARAVEHLEKALAVLKGS